MRAVLLSCFVLFLCFSGAAQSDSRLTITAITPSESTGQDYSPWLSDDLSKLVLNNWLPPNDKYIDIRLELTAKSLVSKLTFYDFEGIFADAPATFYAVNGTQQTYLGKFTGDYYMQWVDIVLSSPVIADAIVIHKFRNNIPQKIQVFGQPYTGIERERLQSVINFAALPVVLAGSTPFTLSASSNNTQTPVTFTSSNPSVLSVTLQNGMWEATPLAAGTAIVTAVQAESASYVAASPVSQRQVVEAIVTAPQPTPEPTPPPTPVAGRISIDKKRWYQLNNTSQGLDGLFDGVTNVKVETGWGKIFDNYDAWYPVRAGESMTITAIKFFDWEGSNSNQPMTLSVVKSNGQRIAIATFKGELYNRWVGPDPSNPDNFNLSEPISDVKYLVINNWSVFPTEIELYGAYTAPPPFPTVVKASVPFSQQFGVNAFEWNFEDPFTPYKVDEQSMQAAKSFTGIRHYIDWEKLESAPGSYTYNPTHSGGWNYDAIYERCKAEGIEVLACLKTIPKWMENSYPVDKRDYENVPLFFGREFSDPNSYIEQAKVAFQYIARYGSNPNVDRSLLSVNATPRWYGDGVNTVKVGLDLIRYIECDNERDKWWKGRKAYQTAYEYAANLSAFYDGHKNTMGAGVGVKNADPSIKVVMAGLAAASTEYVRGMIEWCRQNRGYKADGSVDLCWDVINYHYYSNNASSSQGGNASRGAAPEVAGTAAVANEFIEMANQYAGGMPVWVTEAGYDVNQGSPLKAISIGSKSPEQTQGDWILRTALLYARTGIERTFFYQMYDDNLLNSGQFNSMGLIHANKTRKPAADFLLQAHKLLGSYSYKETLNADPVVDRYESNNESIYSLVVPDEKDRQALYTLQVNSDSVYIYTPTQGRDFMKLRRLKTDNGSVRLTVTETPVFVKPVGLSSAIRKGFKAPEEEGDAIVYPNPASESIRINLQNDQTGIVEVKIIEGGSGKVYSESRYPKEGKTFYREMDIQRLPPGIHVVEITLGDEKITRKIVKL
jgi:hypothetical protein